MKKVIHIILKVIFSIILVFPVLGILGFFPPPTRELYNTDVAFDFIMMLFESRYINYVMAVVHVLALVSLWTKREALAALLMLPLTVNIIGFHAFLDGGLLMPGAIMANMLLFLNLYFLWVNREAYRKLLLL